MVEAHWSGKYPNLCSGEWTLKVNNQNVTEMIPISLQTSQMNTYGVYQSWHFENWDEVFESYIDGLDKDDWIAANDYWLNEITNDYSVKVEIFRAIQSEDFRTGSCGGCI